MSSSSALRLFLFSIALFSVSCLSSSNPFILPIKRDPATNLFYTSVGIGTPRHNFNLTIDIAGENLWYECDKNYNSSSFHPSTCALKTCPDAAACFGCNGPSKPACTNITCFAYTINPFSKFIFSSGLVEDFIYISQEQVPRLLSTCLDIHSLFPSFTGDDSPLRGLPKRSAGIVGLSRSQLALQTQLAMANNLPPKFSLCLPSLNNLGYTNLLVKGKEVSKFVLQTTPLIINPIATGVVSVEGAPSTEYFINVKSIKIDGHVVNIKPSLFSIDNKGNGGTKISTMTNFTAFERTAYKTFIRKFRKKASDRKLKREASVPPFEACFDSTTVGKSWPTIDLVLQGGVKWTIHGANSIILAKKNVACLAIVDGGTPELPFVKASIVIGGYQLQDNLLVFDLASSKLSFSSSLLLQNASCSHP